MTTAMETACGGRVPSASLDDERPGPMSRMRTGTRTGTTSVTTSRSDQADTSHSATVHSRHPDECPDRRDNMLPSHREFFDRLIASGPDVWQSGQEDRERLYETFEATVSTYQEQPQLLDPVLEGLVGRLACVLFEACKETASARAAGPCSRSSLSSSSQSALERASYVSRYLWKVSSARGYKAVLRFMPCDVFSVEPVLRFLNAERGDGHMSWECQYVLLMWSSQLVMVPFAFGVVCETHGDRAESDVIGGLVQTCKDLLRSASKSRDMAAVCLGRLLTRPDMGDALVGFGSWAEHHVASEGRKGPEAGEKREEKEEKEENEEKEEKTRPTSASLSLSRQFLLPGISLAMATIFKFGKADDGTIAALVSRFVPIAIQLYESAGCARNPLVRKLCMKIVQRGAALIVTSNQVRLEEEGVEELLGAAVMALLAGLSDWDTVVRWSAAKGVGRLAAKLQMTFADQLLDSILERNLSDAATGEDAWHGGCLAVAELARRELIASRRVHDLVPVIRVGLEYDVRRGYTSVGTNVRDAAAYVCWALARTQSRDDMASALQTLAPVLMTTACYDREVNCRRAASAAFQECVGRLGEFSHGIDILTVADYFSVSLRTSAYLDVAPLVAAFEGYHAAFADHLMGAKLSHWDKSVRELGAEALARLVPIDPDYHRVVTVTRLVNACLVSTAQDGTHGATLALACILLALKKEGRGSPEPEVGRLVIEAIVHLAGTFNARGATGTLAGGENMRCALCRLIESVCICGMPSTATVSGPIGAVFGCMYDVCRENLHHPAEDVQGDAARALAALLDAHIDDPAFHIPLDEVVSRLARDLHPDLHFGARRGAALALGKLPARLIPRSKDAIFDAVSTAIYPEEQLSVRDVETRVNAIRALPHIVRSATRGTDESSPGETRPTTMHELALDALLVALEDYSTDNRGDIGSWAREAAVFAGVDLLLDTIAQHGAEAFPTETSQGVLVVDKVAQFVAKTARLTMERIGRVRCGAGRCLQRLLRDTTLASALRLPPAFVVSASELTEEDLLEGRASSRLLSACLVENPCSDPDDDSAAPVGSHPGNAHECLASEALLGAVYAIGGLDADLREYTSSHLVSCISHVLERDAHGAAQVPIGDRILSLWRPRARHARLSGPFIQTTETLLSRTDLLSDDRFVTTAVEVTLEAIQGSTDIAKLCKASSLLGVVAGEDESGRARASAAMGLVTLMGRKYPKVRVAAAEELYTATLTWEEMVEAEEDLFSIFTATPWGGANAPFIRDQRLKLREKLMVILNIE